MKTFITEHLNGLKEGEAYILFPEASLIYFVERGGRTSIVEDCLKEHLVNKEVMLGDTVYLSSKIDGNIDLKVGTLSNIRYLIP